MSHTILIIFTLLLFSSYGQIVNIPDQNFKNTLLGNPQINTNFDNEIQISEANSYIGEINCSGLSIMDLTGIEAFTSLTVLNCGLNQLTVLDLSQNDSLLELRCHNNNLTALDVSQNTLLKKLFFPGNAGISSIDLSQNSALTYLMFAQTSIDSIDLSQNELLDTLNVSWNSITTIDISQNSNLKYLDCSYNPVNSLDVSQSTNLIYLKCSYCLLECLNVSNGNNVSFSYFDASMNQNLTCIEVDDASWSNSNWTNIDAQMSFSEACNNACSSSVSEIDVLNAPTSKKVIHIKDLMGRETTPQKNKVLIYFYSDGSSQKVFETE